MCFFAVRPIEAGEELSVHYGCVVHKSVLKIFVTSVLILRCTSFLPVHRLTHGIQCRCGSTECRDSKGNVDAQAEEEAMSDEHDDHSDPE